MRGKHKKCICGTLRLRPACHCNLRESKRSFVELLLCLKDSSGIPGVSSYQDNLMRFCSHFTDRETKVLPSYLVICCNSRPRLVLTSSPSLFVHVYWLISLFLQCGVKNRFPVISTRELAPCHFLFVFFKASLA